MKKIKKIADELASEMELKPEISPQETATEPVAESNLPDDEYFSNLWTTATASEKQEVNNILAAMISQSLDEQLSKLSDDDKLQIIKNLASLLGESSEPTASPVIKFPEPPEAISGLAAAASKIYKSIIKY